MRSDGHAPDDAAFQVKGGAEVSFDPDGIDGLAVESRQFVDLVGTQAWIDIVPAKV